MKIKFCDYIKTAKIGDKFIYLDTTDIFILTKIKKKYSLAIEICKGDDGKEKWDRREEVQWDNEDKDKIAPIVI